MDKGLIVKLLMDSNPEAVEFGSASDAVDAVWFDKAEQALCVKLTESYKWFLRNYSGGEIGEEEIFSIYGIDFEEVNGGDIVYQHLVNQKNGLTNSDKVVVNETNLGEVFFFDYSKFDGKECPIYLRLPSGRSERYANDFYEFLKKRIETHLS